MFLMRDEKEEANMYMYMYMFSCIHMCTLMTCLAQYFVERNFRSSS